MQYYVFASGSKGNCSALVNDQGKIILIDCGITIVELERKFKEFDLDIVNVKKVLMTHLHGDHSLSIRAFDKSIIYAHESTGLDLPKENLLKDYSYFDMLGFTVLVLPMSHDSVGTIGFVFTYKDEKMAYITDTGYLHQDIQRLINNCSVYLIESNHDPRMLMMTKRPFFLKQRILSMEGHLSNQDCALALANVIGPNTKEITFLHRSLEANSEEMLMETFIRVMKQKEIDITAINLIIARQFEAIKGGEKYEYQK